VARAQPGAKPDLAQAAALVRAGKAEEAWQLLAPHEARHAGRAEFDYQLAVAALESGRANRASFILERILAVEPGHLAARLELARSYVALHDYERARRELDLILQADPAAETRALVERLSKSLRGKGAAGVELAGYFELTAGHDTNASAAMAQSSVFLPGLDAEFIPEAGFARRADGFGAVAAGVELASALTERHAVFGGVDVRQRMHEDVAALDATNIDLRAGLQSQLDARDRLRFTLRHHEEELDYARYRRVRGMAVEWARLYGERARLAIAAQGQRVRYLQPDLAASSSDLVALAASGGWLLDQASRKLVVASAYLGHDNATAGRADGDRYLAGLSFGLQRRLGARLEGYASASILHSDYQDRNPDFAITRRDRQTDLALGLVWQLAEGWSLRPQLLHTRNRSNTQINDYKRTEASLTVRFVWD
jgi:hypothetical protein